MDISLGKKTSHSISPEANFLQTTMTERDPGPLITFPLTLQDLHPSGDAGLSNCVDH